jgi:pullulanase-type alpha-1,6-glucosidase
LHYPTPEGRYATDPDGTPRIVEFREMVQSLNETGLRVVMDVVYNHTNASGQSDNSVLDRVVPGYYHRLSADGNMEKSTCCENTATEHNMMRKLMIDSVLTWAKEYKVDGFRFDLMGHHMLADMQAVRAALDSLTLEKDSVDGKSIYVYGEGWDFGEVANNARGVNATQLNIGGTGIGVFNDRLRDGVRGGSPFSDPREQGFATGLVLADNAAEQRPMEDQQTRLFEYTDWIRLGLAGNLSSYEFVRADGQTVPGRLIYYNNAPAGYIADPQENIVYVSAHDNETLFDAIQAKAPAEAALADRIRMNNLALSTAMFSQGVPFFHAGDDILRSKSLDRNSYDSGDWFNELDWTYQSNNWGVGLPIEGSDRWDIFRPLLADPNLKPSPADIQNAAAYFRELLQIRKSSPLFRLRTAAQVKQSVSFLNSGPEQVPGLIVMRLSNVDGLDEHYKEIVVLFNACPDAVTFGDASFAGQGYVLHPVQQNSVDAMVETAVFEGATGTFTVPGRTTAVFVVKAQAARSRPAPCAPPAVPPTPPPTPGAGPALSGTEIAWLAGIVVAAALGALYLWQRRRK